MLPAAEAHAVVFGPQFPGQKIGTVAAVVGYAVQAVGRGGSTVWGDISRGQGVG